MTIIESQPRPDLVRRATDLVDLIRKHSAWHEENRELHQEVLDALDDAELLKMRIPARYGGSVADLRTVVDVISELGRADGSVGWSCVSFTMASWLSSLLPDEAQDEIWADPNVRFCGSVDGRNGVAVPTEGGYILNGKWHFNTGSPHATWDAHFAMLMAPDAPPEPVLMVVPVSKLTLIDDWHTSGLRGTGSRTSVAKDLFVPEGWLVRMVPMLNGELFTELNADYQAWHVPFMQMAIAVASAPALGMARAAMEAFLERVQQREISYTHYERQSEAPITHLQVGEAAQLIDEASYHLYRMVDRLDTKSAAGEPWTVEEKAVARMDAGAVVGRSREAVDILANSAGASSIYSHLPLQRIQRDVGALHQHGIMYPNTNLETLGRVMLGLEPNTDFL
jgi:3-hydroxy-9,10-secoandrosta-1,3,5(10)-triene-9,17-dione monooxygenase